MSELTPDITPKSDTDYHKEKEGFDIEWEIVPPGSPRWKELVANTITNGLLQSAAVVHGYAENAASNDPRLGSMKEFYADEARNSAMRHAEHLRVLRDLLLKPDNQVPVVKKYDNPHDDLISLSKLLEMDKIKLAKEKPIKEKPAQPTQLTAAGKR